MYIEDIDFADDTDFSTDEFEEKEESLLLKFEKRKAGKNQLDDTEEFAASLECPFCGEISDDLRSHLQNCEFAPEDASIDDILPSKKRKRKRKTTSKSTGASTKDREPQEKKQCPYCGKEFIRLGRHLNSCKKKPADAEPVKD